jgi:hypothetical protein
MDATIETNAGGVTNGELELAEEATRAGKSNGHGAEFAEDFVPLFSSSSLLGAGNRVEDGLEALAAVQRELEGHGFSVEKPTKHELTSAPIGIALVQFLDGDGFLAGWVIVGAEGPKQAIDSMQKDAANGGTTRRSALNDAEVVVHVDVEVGEDPGAGLERREGRIGGGRSRERVETWRRRRARRDHGRGDGRQTVAGGFQAVGRKVINGAEKHGVGQVRAGFGDD